MRRLGAWHQLALGLVLPTSCAACDRSTDSESIRPMLCDDCSQVFTPRKRVCARCGLQLKSELGCFGCRNKKFEFDEVHTLGPYVGALAECVVRMKYEEGQPLAFAVGRHLAKRLGCADRRGQFDIITCVPKHWTKRFLTGINGPEAIMDGFAYESKSRAAADLMRCSRRIRKQSLLSPEQRRRNVRRAWTVSPDFDLNQARVLVIDDIMTTGSTAHEMARSLKESGAETVSIAVVGRAQ